MDPGFHRGDANAGMTARKSFVARQSQTQILLAESLGLLTVKKGSR
jgi:hypothetical protein